MQKWSILNRFRTAVRKLRFLLNFSLHRWRVASMIGASPRRLMSFDDRPGLRVCASTAEDETGSRVGGLSSSNSFSPRRSLTIHRTTSYPSEEDDIDKRAELFIANFHKQLQMERQVSLELRYCRGNSFGWVSP